jgi:post-segregation antitoxin (ccd killing protein)
MLASEARLIIDAIKKIELKDKDLHREKILDAIDTLNRVALPTSRDQFRVKKAQAWLEENKEGVSQHE